MSFDWETGGGLDFRGKLQWGTFEKHQCALQVVANALPKSYSWMAGVPNYNRRYRNWIDNHSASGASCGRLRGRVRNCFSFMKLQRISLCTRHVSASLCRPNDFPLKPIECVSVCIIQRTCHVPHRFYVNRNACKNTQQQWLAWHLRCYNVAGHDSNRSLRGYCTWTALFTGRFNQAIVVPSENISLRIIQRNCHAPHRVYTNRNTYKNTLWQWLTWQMRCSCSVGHDSSLV